MALPLHLTLPQTQTQWSAELNPVLSNPLINGQLLSAIKLSNGQTTVNHKLGRKLQGWFIVGIDAPATIYDAQANNQTPQITLSLVSNAVTTVTLWVF